MLREKTYLYLIIKNLMCKKMKLMKSKKKTF